MKQILFFFALLSLISCVSYQNTTHSFTYHGTDNLGLDQNFFYVAYGVQGISNTSYFYRGYGDYIGGDVRAGLVADAKSNLISQHPLEPNQTYANLSVDVMRTEKGELSGGAIELESVTLTAIITADVIEYGTPPEGYKLPVKKRGITTSLPSKAPNSQKIDSNGNQEAKEDSYLFVKGESLWVTYRGLEIEGVVDQRMMGYSGATYKVIFDDNGKLKRKWFYESNLRKKTETTEE